METITKADKVRELMDANQYEQAGKLALELTGAKLKIRLADEKSAPWDDGEGYRPHYRCTFSKDGKRYTFDFWDSIVSGQRGDKAKPYDIISAVIKQDPGTFADFCGDFGYDEDSRKAHRTYRACVKQWQRMSEVFTPEDLDILAEIN